MPNVRQRRHAPQPPAEPPADPGAAAGRTPVRIAVAPQLGIWADLLQAHLSTTRYLVTVGIPASADIALVPAGSAKAIQGLRGSYPSIGLLVVNDRPGYREPAEIATLLEADADVYCGGDHPDELCALIQALARRLTRPSR